MRSSLVRTARVSLVSRFSARASSLRASLVSLAAAAAADDSALLRQLPLVFSLVVRAYLLLAARLLSRASLLSVRASLASPRPPLSRPLRTSRLAAVRVSRLCLASLLASLLAARPSSYLLIFHNIRRTAVQAHKFLVILDHEAFKVIQV